METRNMIEPSRTEVTRDVLRSGVDQLAEADIRLVDRLTCEFHECKTVYDVIVMMARIPSLVLVGWECVLRFDHTADLLHHLLGFQEIKDLVDARIKYLKGRQN